MLNETVRRKYTAMYVAMGLMFALLAGQLYRLQIVEGGKYVALAENNRVRNVQIKAPRGVIYERNGTRLVLNNPSYNVSITAADLPDVNCAVQNIEGSKVLQELSALLAPRVDGAAKVPYVIALKPAELAAANEESLSLLGAPKQGEVANLLSNILQLHADNLRTPINDLMQNYGTSQSIFPVRKDVTAEQAQAIQAVADQLPGISVFTEVEYNFLKGFEDCLKPVVVQQVGYDTMQSLSVQVSKLRGVTVSPEPVRHYVDGPLYSHLLGYVGRISEEEYTAAQVQYGEEANPYGKDDTIGKTGLEASLDEQLRGKKGMQSVVVNSHEQVVSELAYQAPITGNNVTLTIDAKLQAAVTDALRRGLENAKVKAGVAIVVRVSDGQVLSMVSLPSYDNNLFTRGIKQQDFDSLLHDPTLPMFNRAVGGSYPPGSTYKMISAAAALQEGVVNVDTKLVCPGLIEVPFTGNETRRNPYRDWRAAGHGTINVIEALMVSSDVFFYITAGPRQEDQVIKKSDGTRQVIWTRYYHPNGRTPFEFNGLGIQRLSNYARAFGLGSKTGIGLPGESAGLVPDQSWKDTVDPSNPWSLGDTLVTAIGQGYNLVTPLQLVNVTAAVANGGTLYKPQLVEKITGPNGELVQGYTPQVLGQVPVSPENLAIVREGMRQVVVNQTRGTAAQRITLKSFEWAGKTGTAEFGDIIRMEKDKEIRRAHAWFTAFAPFDKPEIAVVVLLEGGEESLEGSTFAVPVTDEILKAYFKVDK